MAENSTKSHVFHKQNRKVNKSSPSHKLNTSSPSPASLINQIDQAPKLIIAMASFLVQINQVPESDIAMAVRSGGMGPEIRAKMIATFDVTTHCTQSPASTEVKVSAEADPTCAVVVNMAAPDYVSLQTAVESSVAKQDGSSDVVIRDFQTDASSAQSTSTPPSSISYPPQSETDHDEEMSQTATHAHSLHRTPTVPSIFICGSSDLKIFGRPTLPRHSFPTTRTVGRKLL